MTVYEAAVILLTIPALTLIYLRIKDKKEIERLLRSEESLGFKCFSLSVELNEALRREVILLGPKYKLVYTFTNGETYEEDIDINKEPGKPKTSLEMAKEALARRQNNILYNLGDSVKTVSKIEIKEV